MSADARRETGTLGATRGTSRARWQAAAFLCAALLLFTTTVTAPEPSGYDLVPLLAAARLVATGETAHLYSQNPRFYNETGDPVFARAARDAGAWVESTPYVYPPLVAVALQPISNVPMATVLRIWTAFSVLLVALSLYLIVRVYSPDWNPLLWTGVLLVASSVFEPVRYGLWLSQATALIVPLVVGAVACERRGRHRLAGAMLALAVFIKLTPAVLVLTWAWRGPRRALAWCCGTLFVLWGLSYAAVGTAANLAYLERVRSIGHIALASFNSHSFLSVFCRLFDRTDAWRDWRILEPGGLTTAAAAVAALVVLGPCAAAVARLPRETRAWRPCAEAWAYLAMLLLPGISWSHYFVFLVPVMMVVAVHWPGAGVRAPGWLVVAGAFALCCRPLFPPQHVTPPAFVWPRMAGPTLSAVLLAFALTWVAVAIGRATPPHPPGP
jgi:hypothetical protein